jgi:AmmeMemoRadiSam system protein B
MATSKATEWVRPPAVAGTFYPDDPARLSATLAALLEAADPTPDPQRWPRALIAPHAGYVYSGPIAASAYVRIAAGRGTISRVVLLGPAHRVAVRGLATSTAGSFATPLGRVPLDHPAIDRCLGLPGVCVSDEAHAPEHSLEVQLPFLQAVLGDFALVPLVVGDATPDEVAGVLDALWGGSETLVVVSSDLSHYEPYSVAAEMDDATSRAIEALRPGDISYHQACGRVPVQGLLLAAKRRGLGAETLDVRSSGDTAGSRDAVVGYGAWSFA